jgi:hypothetical protein
MARAVDRRLLTLVAREQCQADPCDTSIYGGQSGTGARFSPSTSVILCLHLCTNIPHPPSSTRCCNQKDKRVRPEKPSKTQCTIGNRGALAKQEVSLLSSLKCYNRQ